MLNLSFITRSCTIAAKAKLFLVYFLLTVGVISDLDYFGNMQK